MCFSVLVIFCVLPHIRPMTSNWGGGEMNGLSQKDVIDKETTEPCHHYNLSHQSQQDCT